MWGSCSVGELQYGVVALGRSFGVGSFGVGRCSVEWLWGIATCMSCGVGSFGLGRCGVGELQCGELLCGGVALLECCILGKLQCGGIAVWGSCRLGSCSIGELRCGMDTKP